MDKVGFWAYGWWTHRGAAGMLPIMGDFNEPFRGSLAVAAGLVTKGQLRGPGFRKLFPDIYLPANIAPTLAMRSHGAYLLVAGSGDDDANIPSLRQRRTQAQLRADKA